MKQEDIKFDEIYFSKDYCDKPNNNFICLYKGNYSPFIPDITNSHSNKKFTNGMFITSNITRLATPEECHWLECCIEKNKYISYEEAMETFTKPKLTFNIDYRLNEILEKLLNNN